MGSAYRSKRNHVAGVRIPSLLLKINFKGYIKHGKKTSYTLPNVAKVLIEIEENLGRISIKINLERATKAPRENDKLGNILALKMSILPITTSKKKIFYYFIDYQEWFSTISKHSKEYSI